MRVPTITTYTTSTYLLGNLSSGLKDANEVVSTQKRIIEISDDPVGFNQVLTLKDTMGNLEQIEQNVAMGQSWLDTGETALDSIHNLMLEVKTEVTRLANDSTTADERANAIERINGVIEQMVTLGNTRVNGNYVFGGTDSNIIPFAYDKDGQPEQVVYNGNHTPFEIRTDKNVGVAVGRDGEETFWDQTIQINASNNTLVFQEDIGRGSAFEKRLTAVVPDGVYTAKTLEQAVENVLNSASETSGYQVNYQVAFDADQKKYTLQTDGRYPGFIQTTFLWEDGKDAHLDQMTVGNGIDPDNLDIQVLNSSALTLETTEQTGPLRFVWDGYENWRVENNPGYIIPAKIPGTAHGFALELTESGAPDISVKLGQPAAVEGAYVAFEIMLEKGDHSIGHEMGFSGVNSLYTLPVSEVPATAITDLTIVSGVNDTIDFIEKSPLSPMGGGTSAELTAVITAGNYTDMDALCLEIQTRMAEQSVNTVDYAVSYDPETSRFNIREDGSSLDELDLLWKSGTHSNASIGSTLGYYQTDDELTYPGTDNTPVQCAITIDETNDILDFEEVNNAGVSSGTLRAFISHGTYTSMTDLLNTVETAMAAVSANGVGYTVAYDNAVSELTIQSAPGALNELRLFADSDVDSIKQTLGFDLAATGDTTHTSDTRPVLMTFGSDNNWIDFQETSSAGLMSDPVSIEIPKGDYTNLDAVAQEIQTALRAASPLQIAYDVGYDFDTGKFLIKGSDQDLSSFSLLWKTGNHSDSNAAQLLGFDPARDDVMAFAESDQTVIQLNIDETNNTLDFQETVQGSKGKIVDTLTALIEPGTYTTYPDLAREIEQALEQESHNKGNDIDYAVSWDDHTQRFTIKEAGTRLEEFRLLWQSGENAPTDQGGTGLGIGALLGFDGTSDDIKTPLSGTDTVSWGIFDTLIDLKTYLADNDRDGIERTLGRLGTHYDNMTSRIVDTGMKYNHLEVRQTITTQMGLSLMQRKSTIEDADLVESIMALQNLQTAYEAAMSSTAKVMSLSLLDYL
ncbi:flagellar hook-associated protein FlgL [Desulfobacula sp.]|uniref:flagellar hook-associated protein FlgL n=1 Tax=Desulfobacula sp. TaxID=2593537 RepID=UPI002606B535|nr:flagellar hook-associated protein FlgL [Desulfobacula sp.]